METKGETTLMHTFELALRLACVELSGERDEQLEQFLRRERFERAVAYGRQLLLEATTATWEDRLRDALTAVRRDRHACAACIAHQFSTEQKCFVPVRIGFAELERMEELWEQKLQEQHIRHAQRNGNYCRERCRA